MKAAVFQKVNDLVLTERPIPEIKEGEALVRVKCIGICGTDVHVLKGAHPTAVYPVIPGHEFVGEVAEIKGDRIDGLKPGDLVVAQEVISCGICDACAKGTDNACENLKIQGIHADGGFAEYVKVKSDKLVKIPQEMNLEQAALIEPLAVAVHDVSKSTLQAGESALIIGGGPIGFLNALICRLSGAGLVVISEPSKYRRDFAVAEGFTVLNPFDDNFDERLNELTEGHGFDVSFDAAGAPNALNVCIDHTKSTGHVVVIAISANQYPLDMGKVFMKELTMVGVRIHTMYDFKRATEIVVGGVLNKELSKLVSKVFTLDEVTDAFEYAMTDQTAFKTLVRIGD